MKLRIHHRKGNEVVLTTIGNADVEVSKLAQQIARLRETDGAMSFSLPGPAGAIIPARNIELVELSADD